jgi:hypothetical protein
MIIEKLRNATKKLRKSRKLVKSYRRNVMAVQAQTRNQPTNSPP